MPTSSPCSAVVVLSSFFDLGSLEAFLRNLLLPPATTLFVAQRLAPDFPGLLERVIKRSSKYPVRFPLPGEKVLDGVVYPYPVGSQNGVMLSGESFQRQLRPVFSLFFRSLLEAERKVALVVLGGLGNEFPGMVDLLSWWDGPLLVQDPASTPFRALPVLVQQKRFVQRMLPPDQLGSSLEELFPGHNGTAPPPSSARDVHFAPAFLPRVFSALREHTGRNLDRYRKNTIVRRIERRMILLGISQAASYVELLQASAEEANSLLHHLQIHVTSFFRDPGAFEALAQQALPLLGHDSGSTKLWVAGCSTGQEAFSLAMLFQERWGPAASEKVHIVASDVDPASLQFARQAVYATQQCEGIPTPLLQRFFHKVGNGYQPRSLLRDMVEFKMHDVLVDPPLLHVDLVSCRNLLIYLEPSLQQEVLSLFHFSLRPGGLLFLGKSESTRKMATYFHPLVPRWKIFRRKKK